MTTTAQGLARMRRQHFTALIVCILTSVCPFRAQGEESTDLLSFLGTYQCAVADLIGQIHAHPDPENQDRFIILNPEDQPSSYVQCAFDHADREAYCEAASGFYAAPGEAPYLGSSERRALTELGFAMDGSQGNFQQRLRFSPEVDPSALARFMLTALYGGYGARARMTIEVQAPFALPHGMLPQRHCVPTS